MTAQSLDASHMAMALGGFKVPESPTSNAASDHEADGHSEDELFD